MDQQGAGYIPLDRYSALLEQRELPVLAVGAVLFADISGFTTLTEAYARLLGPRRGSEELTRQLNLIYDALVAEVSRYGGSVVGFSGDAITCWFDESWPASGLGRAAPRAVACGAGMHTAMRALASLDLPDGTQVSIGVKVAIAYGTAYRYLVGDPNIQLIDVLAGDLVTRVGAADHLLAKGELLVDRATVQRLNGALQVAEWRLTDETNDEFAKISDVLCVVAPARWTEPDSTTLDEALVRPWLMRSVYERMQIGNGEFPAELRPVSALFLRFRGINYADADAEHQLDRFVRWVQKILSRYDASLLQVTLGDKGSYLYAVVGAPVAHEDYIRRAVSAATELRDLPREMSYVEQVQLGVSQGIMRVGAYGGQNRRTYGVLGDEVNVAARLMQHARPGEILGTGHVNRSTKDEFVWESLPPLSLKGKSSPITVSRLIGRRSDYRRNTNFSGLLVGREQQLSDLINLIQTVSKEKTLGITYVAGEPGMGKSRLLFEVQRQLGETDDYLWMTCPSDEVFRESLQPFRHFFRQYFSQSSEQSSDENRERFNDVIEGLFTDLNRRGRTDLKEDLERTESFLAALVDLYRDDSLYAQAEPRLRFERTIEAVRTLVEAISLRTTLILHIEDGHWLDKDSIELIGDLINNCVHYPIAILITCRFQDDGSPWNLGIETPFPQHTVTLKELSRASIAILSAQVLGSAIGEPLAGFLEQKTGGNPFFVEQLVLDLRERGLLQQDEQHGWFAAAEMLAEVPGSVSAILIARLDRLAPRVRHVVQTAAVLGAEFAVPVLSRMIPDDAHIINHVNQAESAAIWGSTDEGRYLFRHVLLRDAAYDMQLSSQLRQLHQSAGAAIEEVYAVEASTHANEIAYHYEAAVNLVKAAPWYLRAGENARDIYASENAVRYFEKALTCWTQSGGLHTADPVELVSLYAGLGTALRWQNRQADAMNAYRTMYQYALNAGDLTGQTIAYLGVANIQFSQGDLRASIESARQAEEIGMRSGITPELARVLWVRGWSSFRLGELESAKSDGERALTISTELQYRPGLAQSNNLLGIVRMANGDYARAAEHFAHALEMFREIDDRASVIYVTNNLGVIAFAQGDYDLAAARYEESLVLAKRVGTQDGQMLFLSNLGGAHVGMGRYELAETELKQVIEMAKDAGFSDLSETYRFLAESLLAQNRTQEALEAALKALSLGEEVGAQEFIAVAWRVLGQIACLASGCVILLELDEGERKLVTPVECFLRSKGICEDSGLQGERARVLRAWATYELQHGDRSVGISLWNDARAAFAKMGAQKEIERMGSLPDTPDIR